MVLFNFFHLMAWPYLQSRPRSWPAPAKLFDPARAVDLYGSYIDEMALADELGFDWVGCNEHHFSPFGLMASPTVMGGALTQRVKRARIAMMGSIIPLNDPVRLAEEYAMLDVMSGGRLIAGMIRGTAHEQLAYHTNPDESRDRYEEAFELILKCWTEPEPFGWQGKYFQYRTISIWPQPLQKPHPPIYIPAGSVQSVHFALRRRVGIGAAFVSMDRAKEQFDLYRKLAGDQGWQPPPANFLYDHVIHVQTDGDAARRTIGEATTYFRKELLGPITSSLEMVVQGTKYITPEERARRRGVGAETMATMDLPQQIEQGYVSVGTPDEVVEQLTRVIKHTGVGVVNARFHVGTMTHEQAAASMRLFAKEVLPRVRGLGQQDAPPPSPTVAG
ncbi:MAG TPA: LLM class flavin-dependent oxidoreductase [Candidatus Limnocylindria bacterium]|nr:LLM class flavin-dependent oxidoreductase [Candidatus Limnocylindria bacterium]